MINLSAIYSCYLITLIIQLLSRLFEAIWYPCLICPIHDLVTGTRTLKRWTGWTYDSVLSQSAFYYIPCTISHTLQRATRIPRDYLSRLILCARQILQDLSTMVKFYSSQKLGANSQVLYQLYSLVHQPQLLGCANPQNTYMSRHTLHRLRIRPSPHFATFSASPATSCAACKNTRRVYC